jgi:excisionase family DNA binding protein
LDVTAHANAGPNLREKYWGCERRRRLVRQILQERPVRANFYPEARVDDLMKRTLMRQSETKNVLTVAEVAEILRVHSTTIYRLVKRGELPGFKLGGNWRINRASLDLWLLAEHPQHQSPRDN